MACYIIFLINIYEEQFKILTFLVAIRVQRSFNYLITLFLWHGIGNVFIFKNYIFNYSCRCTWEALFKNIFHVLNNNISVYYFWNISLMLVINRFICTAYIITSNEISSKYRYKYIVLKFPKVLLLKFSEFKTKNVSNGWY